MAGKAPAAQEYLDRADAHVDLSPHVLSLHKLIVAVDLDCDLDVAVGADPRNLLSGVFIALLRQRTQGRLVHPGKGAGAAAEQLLEGALVQVGQERAQRLVQLVDAEEALVAQAGLHPALHHQYAVLDFGLVLGPTVVRRQHSNAVLGQVLVGGVDVRFVVRRLRHAAAHVASHP